MMNKVEAWGAGLNCPPARYKNEEAEKWTEIIQRKHSEFIKQHRKE